MAHFEEVKNFLDNINQEHIIFKEHFYEKVKERPISEELVRKYLKKTDRLLKVEEQPSKRKSEQKYKLWIKLSNMYSNTDRKWQKSMQK